MDVEVAKQDLPGGAGARRGALRPGATLDPLRRPPPLGDRARPLVAAEPAAPDADHGDCREQRQAQAAEEDAPRQSTALPKRPPARPVPRAEAQQGAGYALGEASAGRIFSKSLMNSST